MSPQPAMQCSPERALSAHDFRSARSPLVGRTQETAHLQAAFEQAAAGRLLVVLLAGEAGIGKTRLAQDALAGAGRGFLVLEGHAYPMEGGLAYAPLVAALSSHLRSLSLAQRTRLIRGLPDLSRLFVDLELPAAEPLGDPALEKTRLFESVSRLVERLAEETPLALFLDDLHWADPASLELLHYLARRLSERPVLVLGTYRDSELDLVPGLRSLLVSLRRGKLLEELTISRLRPEEIGELARGTLGGEIPAELLRFLGARAAGVPLVAELLLHTLVEEGRLARTGTGWRLAADPSLALPAGVRDLFLDRLGRLSDVERRVVDLVAVHGDAIKHAVLQAASGQPEDALLGIVTRLRTAGLVNEELSGRDVAYGLDHPLLQEVTSAELAEVPRQRIHAAIAAALEQSQPDSLGRLAYHYRGAGAEADAERALEVFLAAGEQARLVYAHHEAAAHFKAALDYLRVGRRRDLLPSVLERLGEAWERLGERAAAVVLWSEVVAAYETLGDAEAVGRVCHQMALAQWELGRFEDAEASIAKGVEAVVGRPDSPRLADLYTARALFFMRSGNYPRFAKAVEELAELASGMETSSSLAQVHFTQSLRHLQRAEYARARESACRLLTVVEGGGAPLFAHYAYRLLALSALSLGDHRAARGYGESGFELAQRLGAPPLEFYPCWAIAEADLLAGEWNRALRAAEELAAATQRLDLRRNVSQPLALQALVLARRGNLEEAESRLREARSALREFVGDRHVEVAVEHAETVVALEGGDFPRALEAAIAMVAAGSDAQKAGYLALLAEVQARLGRSEQARQTAREIAGLGTLDEPFPLALADFVEGLALQGLGAIDEARDRLGRAAERLRLLEIPFEYARSRLEWARLAPPGEPEALPAARGSAEIFERLGARPHLDQARALLRSLGIRLPVGGRRRLGSGELSERELEVVRLAATGLTTSEIAKRLFVSSHTVATHLKRVYQRFGIRSRAALVHYAQQAGWLEAEDKTA